MKMGYRNPLKKTLGKHIKRGKGRYLGLRGTGRWRRPKEQMGVDAIDQNRNLTLNLNSDCFLFRGAINISVYFILTFHI